MRFRLSGGRLEVVTADGRHVRYPLGVLGLLLLPLLAAAVAFIAFADPGDGASLRRDLHVATTNLLMVEPVPRDSAIPTIELVVPENTFPEMQRALHRGDPVLRHEPGGDRPFFNALFLEGNNPIACEIAFLAPPGHHDEQKPSLRIKFRKQDARGDGDRRIDLYRPEDPLALEAPRYSQLARRLDLLNDASTPVRLFVNRKPFGVYVKALPPGPAIAHAARRLPGTFVFSTPGSDPWSDPGAWQGFGTDVVAPLPIEALLAVLAASRSAATTEELWRLLDFESLARWAAVRAVLGRTGYAGEQQCLFFAPGHGRIEAVAWPFDGTTGASDAPLAAGDHRLLGRLEQEPDWTRRRDHWIAELLSADLPGTDLAHAPDLATDLQLVERRADALLPVAISDLGRYRVRDAEWSEQRAACLRTQLAVARHLPEEAPERPALELGPGDVELAEDVITAPGQPLVIRAGTRIALRAKVGIYAQGPTTVEGTAAAPVVLRSATWEPWAAFAVIGPATAGSRIAYLDTQDGSTGQLHHQRLDAAFVLYDAPDVAFVHGRFGPSAEDGDSVRIARSQASFEDCLFEDARVDALDAMYSTGRLDGCRFIVAGRNGLDLFASRFEIERSHFDCAMRAAVSVGEDSQASIVDTVLQRSDMGLDGHDDGRALLRRVRFQANRIGLFCEHRDWRQDRGGTVALDRVGFFANIEGDVSAGSRSIVLIHDSGEPRITLGAHRTQLVDGLPEGWLDGDGIE